MLLLIPAAIFAMWAQYRVKSTFGKYSSKPANSQYAGWEVARKLLDASNLKNVEIEKVPGELTDHYDPRAKVLRLSESTYWNRSISSYGVVAHEVGHALQDAREYFPLTLRNNFVPIAGFGSSAAFPLFFVGLLVSSGLLMDIGILFFAAAVLFHVITLPVELNASSQALLLLKQQNILSDQEIPLAKKVLNAAALTYVAAMAVSLLHLVRLLILRNRNED